MAKTNYIELGTGELLTILYEDRSVMAIDKPAGWMLVPMTWQKTDRNLPAAILSSIASRAHWARSRNLKFLQNVHRLDAETTGILLMVKSAGAARPLSKLFESRQMDKRYLVVVQGRPTENEWVCQQSLGPDPQRIGRVRVDSVEGKPAETHFRVIKIGDVHSLLEATPFTGRTHQIRVHAAESGYPVAGDTTYGDAPYVRGNPPPMGLRAIYLAYTNPFDRKRVVIEAPVKDFLSQFGFRQVDLASPAPPLAKIPRPPAASPMAPSAVKKPAPISIDRPRNTAKRQ